MRLWVLGWLVLARVACVCQAATIWPTEEQEETFENLWQAAGEGAFVGITAGIASSTFQDTEKDHKGIGIPFGVMAGMASAAGIEFMRTRNFLLTHLTSKVDMDKFYGASGCPFAEWFPRVESRTKAWEKRLEHDYSNKLKSRSDEDRRKPAITTSDTQQGAFIGQGKTVAFLAGYMDKNPHFDIAEHVPLAVRSHLIARFSTWDRGADSVLRVALKIKYPSDQTYQCGGQETPVNAWANELNLLFSEGVPTFGLASYAELWKAIIQKDDARVATAADQRDIMRKSLELPLQQKSFHTQLPHAFGCTLAAKFSLEPMAPITCSVPDEAPPTHESNLRELAKGDVEHFGEPCKLRWKLIAHTLNLEENQDLIDSYASTKWRGARDVEMGVVVLQVHPDRHDPVTPRLRPRRRVADPEPPVVNEELVTALLRTSLGVENPHIVSLRNSHIKEYIPTLFAFHPIVSANNVRPLGQINTFRSHYYAIHGALRFEWQFQQLQEKLESNRFEKLPDRKYPFVVAGETWSQRNVFVTDHTRARDTYPRP
jgi:hypothetical protein